MAAICVTLGFEWHIYRSTVGTNDLGTALVALIEMGLVGSFGLGGTAGFITGKWWVGVLATAGLLVIAYCWLLP